MSESDSTSNTTRVERALNVLRGVRTRASSSTADQGSPSGICDDPPDIVFGLTWLDDSEVPLLCGECREKIVVTVNSADNISDVECGCEETPSMWCFKSDSEQETNL